MSCSSDKLSLAFAAILCATGCGADDTQLIVSVDSDLAVPAELDTIRVSILATANTPLTEAISSHSFGIAGGGAGFSLPFSFGVTQREGTDSLDLTLVIEAFAPSSQQPSVVRRVSTSFIADKTLHLPIFLSRSCVGELCSPGQTCVDGTCRAEYIDPTSLDEIQPGEGLILQPRLQVDAGTGRDAGAPTDAEPTDRGLVDAGVTMDASPGDASVGPDADIADATAPDAQPNDAQPTDAAADASTADALPSDAAPPDSGTPDAGFAIDTGPPDSGCNGVRLTHPTPGMPEVIETETTHYARTPAVAMDESGAAVVAWMEWDGVRFSVWSNYHDGSDWAGAAAVENTTAPALYPAVALDGQGKAIIAWQENTTDVVARELDPSTGFSAPVTVDNRDENISRVYVKSRPTEALIVWTENPSGQTTDIYGNWLRGTIGTPFPLEVGPLDPIFNVDIALNPSGVAMMVLENRPIGVNGSIHFRRYNPGNMTWSPMMGIPQDPTFENIDPHLGMDASGNALLAWRKQNQGGITEALGNRHDGTTWGMPPVRLDGPSGSAAWPRSLASDSCGNGLAVWYEFQQNENALSVYANAYRAGWGWTGERLVELAAEDARSPRVAMNASGDGIAAWRQNNQVWINTYVQGQWGTAQRADQGLGPIGDVRVAMGGSGRGLVVWEEGALLNTDIVAVFVE